MMNYSLLNGFWDGAAAWIADLLAQVFDFIMDLFNRLFYFLFSAIGQLADMVQALFRAFCGLGTNAVFGSGHPTDDVYIIFQSPRITNILIAMGALSLLLLIITTGIAVVKTEFVGLSEKGGNSKSKVIGTALKSLANIVVVPLCCIISVLAVNAVLRAVDEITAGGESISFSSQVFGACAYDANKLRTDYDVEKGFTSKNFAVFLQDGVNTFGVDFEDYYNVSGANAASTQEEKYAMVVDYLFKNGISFGEDFLEAWEEDSSNIVLWKGDVGDGNGQINEDDIDSMEEGKYYVYFQGSSWGENKSRICKIGYFSIYNPSVVKVFYDIGQFNIIVALLAIIVVAYNLLVIVLGTVKRFFELTILFVISPTVSAITPLDGGSALKNWRSSFISSLLSLFGPVVAINLFFQILPLMFEINFLSSTGLNAASRAFNSVQGYESLAEILITCAGVIYIKDLSASIGKIFGAGDALSTGEGAKKDFASKVKTAQNIGKTLGAVTTAPIKATGAGLVNGIKTRAAGGSIGHSFAAAGKAMGLSAVSSVDDTVKNATGVYNGVTGASAKNKTWGSDAMDSLSKRIMQGGEAIEYSKALRYRLQGNNAMADQKVAIAEQYAVDAKSFADNIKARGADDFNMKQFYNNKVKDKRAAVAHSEDSFWSQKESNTEAIDADAQNRDFNYKGDKFRGRSRKPNTPAPVPPQPTSGNSGTSNGTNNGQNNGTNGNGGNPGNNGTGGAPGTNGTP